MGLGLEFGFGLRLGGLNLEIVRAEILESNHNHRDVIQRSFLK